MGGDESHVVFSNTKSGTNKCDIVRMLLCHLFSERRGGRRRVLHRVRILEELGVEHHGQITQRVGPLEHL